MTKVLSRSPSSDWTRATFAPRKEVSSPAEFASSSKKAISCAPRERRGRRVSGAEEEWGASAGRALSARLAEQAAHRARAQRARQVLAGCAEARRLESGGGDHQRGEAELQRAVQERLLLDLVRVGDVVVLAQQIVALAAAADAGVEVRQHDVGLEHVEDVDACAAAERAWRQSGECAQDRRGVGEGQDNSRAHHRGQQR